jgi:DNA-binding transcriptional MerR regulator
MNKSPDAFRTISEVAEALDVPPHVLRFWETRFAQVKPVKRGGGRRYYRPEDVRLLRGIRGLLYDDGMTIKGVQKILRERGTRHVIGLGTLPDAEAEAAPAPAKARPAARPPAAPRAQPKAPQPDLFEAPARPVRATRVVRPDDGAGDTLVRTRDRARLKVLLGELESLRRVMMAEPDR